MRRFWQMTGTAYRALDIRCADVLRPKCAGASIQSNRAALSRYARVDRSGSFKLFRNRDWTTPSTDTYAARTTRGQVVRHVVQHRCRYREHEWSNFGNDIESISRRVVKLR